MRFPGSIMPCMLAAAGCACPQDVDLRTPESTLDSFRQAFSCDDAADLEYRCFSSDVKQAFGGLSAYAVGREVFRREHPLLVAYLGLSDLEERIAVAYGEDGNSAVASIDTGEGVLEVLLVNEPEYLLAHPDGSVTREYADRVTARRAGSDQVLAVIQDRDLPAEPVKPIQRIELRSRWVIASLPGLDQAVQAVDKTSQAAP